MDDARLERRVLALLPTEVLSVGGFGLAADELHPIVGGDFDALRDVLDGLCEKGLATRDPTTMRFRATLLSRAYDSSVR